VLVTGLSPEDRFVARCQTGRKRALNEGVAKGGPASFRPPLLTSPPHAGARHLARHFKTFCLRRNNDRHMTFCPGL
jgi:hypothetical protein